VQCNFHQSPRDALETLHSFSWHQFSAHNQRTRIRYDTNLFEEACPVLEGLLMKNVPISSSADVIHEMLLALTVFFTSLLKHTVSSVFVPINSISQ